MLLLLAFFGFLIAWLSMRTIYKEKTLEHMGREADAYFDSIHKQEMNVPLN